MIIFEFVGQFYFQNDVLKLQEDLDLDMRQTREAKKIPKTVLRTRLDSKPKKPRIYFGFREVPCGLLPKLLNKSIFCVLKKFIEDYLRSLMC
jgi:hypothetical protein